jgi:hypothetical protein
MLKAGEPAHTDHRLGLSRPVQAEVSLPLIKRVCPDEQHVPLGKDAERTTKKGTP